MKITEDTLHTLIWNFAEINVYSEDVGSDYYISCKGNEYEVLYGLRGVKGMKRVKRDTKTFCSFRNGDEDSPDMEGFLPMWVETLNAADCTVWISDSSTPEEGVDA